MALGSPITNKFNIGTAELRVGPMSSANKLLEAHSVGLIDSVSLNVDQEAAQLEGGFPRKLVDTAIIRQSSSITANIREYSRRNLNLLVGNGVSGVAPTAFATTLGSTESAGSTVFDVPTGKGASFTAGDLITIYPTGEPHKVSVCRVASISTDSITLDTGTPLLFDYAIGAPIFLSRPVAVGAVSQTNYFAVMMIQKENATGRPLVWSFWKGAIATGLRLETNAEAFASTELQINLLEPAAAEFSGSGALLHLANIIPTNPIGFYAGGAD